MGEGGVTGETRRAEVLLISVTVVWGLTFSLVKESLRYIGPFYFMAWRFWLASIIMGVLCLRRLRRVDRGLLLAGLYLGIALYGSYAFQTFGLKYTTAGNAGFITGLFIVFVPVLSTVFLRRPPTFVQAISLAVALVGLGFLSLKQGMTVNLGDALVLACAFCLSVHIILLDRYAKVYDLMLLTLLQMGVLGAGNTISGLLFESFSVPGEAIVWVTVVVCGALASALAFYVQGYAQRVLSPIRTSIILVMEPVFSVMFGMIILGERLTWRGWLGCCLIFAAMLLTELYSQLRPARGERA